MGVSVDRVLGWMLEITDKNVKNTLDGVLYEERFEDKLVNTKYKNDYGKAQKGDIIILDDGMSGEYTYVVWVVCIDNDCDDYYESDFFDNLNIMLEKLRVTEDIKSDIKEFMGVLGYNYLESEIQLKAIRHYH